MLGSTINEVFARNKVSSLNWELNEGFFTQGPVHYPLSHLYELYSECRTKFKNCIFLCYLGSEQMLSEFYKTSKRKKDEQVAAEVENLISPTLRWLVFGCNVVFWIFGVCAAFIGVWAYIEKQKTKGK